MACARTVFQSITVVSVAALIASGCGGEDAATTTTPPTPTPGSTTPGTNVGNQTTPPTTNSGQVDPTTGQPIDPSAAGGATASIPELIGDDIGGGLGSVSTDQVFVAGAVEESSFDEDLNNDSLTSNLSVTSPSTTTDTDTVDSGPTYSGAKIYVDGIVHSVDKNGTFPEGNPVFRLVSINASEIEIELIAGEFTSGGGVGTILDKGELVTLMNSSEQLTYRLKYLRPVEGSSGVNF